MDKQILEQYIDACELIKETERDLAKLRARRYQTVHDTVEGSMEDFPYAAQRFHIEGVPDAKERCEEALEIILQKRKQAARIIKVQVEEWMLTIPQRMQRIVRYKFFEGLSWGEVAVRIGRKATADGVRMEFTNFMKLA